MPMHLYEHNQTAYNAAVTMLAERGKAAVIHPTGTGKSFIGFKLCEDNPDKTICWLSPSRYIYQTQLENLAETSDGYQPENVKFYTYAKLMNVSDAEISKIKPDYIILDEFHRCGAELWGAGVDAVLKAYPDVPVLGLSATAIRYLDNQRDMTDELFDGNVASEMTLGEAIVRGILNPPKYVLTVYSYQKELEKYEKQIARHRSSHIKDTATKYLEALRRTLEKADGLDVIFDKHIENRSGKYIAFCSSLEMMIASAAEAKKWFARVDKKPHIYKAYSNDPETSKAFADFKADTSEHLKLLFCIDMLNEGIHVEDISGVILLRPTVSPIIYKQQIGRALSASKSTNPVIFDIVNNIDNLYSIDEIREEMQAAITYYRYTGDNRIIINDHFELLDEVADCRALFDKLEGVLNADWDMMYKKAAEYYNEHGDLLIPYDYHTDEGHSLGRWLRTQRDNYSGKGERKLTQVEIDKLEKIGVVWGSHLDHRWNTFFEAAKRYYEQNGDLNVPKDYVVDGLKLGIWILRMRMAQADRRDTVVTPEKKAKLDSIGMIWSKLSEQWEKNYLEAVHYYNEHGNLYMDIKYMTETGFKLGYWVSHLRQKKADLTDEQIRRLDAIGMVWDTEQFKFDQGLRHAKMYHKKHGDLDVPAKYVCADGYTLGTWLNLKRRQYAKGRLSKESIDALETLGMAWNPTEDKWQNMFAEAEQYFNAHNNLNVPRTYKTANGNKLYFWLSKQRSDRKKGTLSEEKIAKLDSIGMRWEDKSEVVWETGLEHLQSYLNSHDIDKLSRSYICEDGFQLGDWVDRQRRSIRENNPVMTEMRQKQLKELGVTAYIKGTKVTSRAEIWENGFNELHLFVEKYGEKKIPDDYITDSGIDLLKWVMSQRKCIQRGTLSAERTEKLNSLGVDLTELTFSDTKWNERFSDLKSFLGRYGRMPKRSGAEKALAVWFMRQKDKYSQGMLAESKVQKFRSIGVDL